MFQIFHSVNIDWLGKIVEQQRGKRLGEVMKERIFGTLGIHDMVLLTNSHHSPIGLAGYGLAIVEERRIELPA